MSHILCPFVRGVRVDNGEWVIGTVVRREWSEEDKDLRVYIDDTRDLQNIKSYEIKGHTWGRVAKVALPGADGLLWTGDIVRQTTPDGTQKKYVVDALPALVEEPDGQEQVEKWYAAHNLKPFHVVAVLKNGPEEELSYLYDDVADGSTGEKWELDGEPFGVPKQDK